MVGVTGFTGWVLVTGTVVFFLHPAATNSTMAAAIIMQARFVSIRILWPLVSLVF